MPSKTSLYPVNTVNLKFILTLMTIIALVIGAFVWASDKHSNLKGEIAEQDFATKAELKETFKEQYAPATRMIKLETLLEETRRTNEKILEKLEQLEQKIERHR